MSFLGKFLLLRKQEHRSVDREESSLIVTIMTKLMGHLRSYPRFLCKKLRICFAALELVLNREGRGRFFRWNPQMTGM